jgi:hypothetical protein
MKKITIVDSASRAFGRALITAKKYSPEILIVAGVVGTVVSTVMACKATTKVGSVIEIAKDQVDTIHEVLDTPELQDKYTKDDGKKDLAIVYAKTGMELVKLYGPAVVMGAASIGCILTSHNIVRKRNIALAAAYATVDQGFKEYRGRVIERFGEELDKELKYNIKAEEVEERVVDEEGNETVETKTVAVADPSPYSMYARCFDDTCSGWTRDAEMNLYFLMQVQEWANKKLRRYGHLTLNEVYEKIGFQKTRAGAEVGWVFDENNPNGDNYVTFHIHDLHDKNKRAFVNGYEKSIWVDFNVDGYILDLLH